MTGCECDDASETVHELVIVRLSLMTGSVVGGDEMIILCEKVKKGDVLHHTAVHFFALSGFRVYELF